MSEKTFKQTGRRRRFAEFALIILCLFFIFGCFQTAFGQQISEPKRPKIGLVLSGGGARGFAHIGVLRVLEENHIPVDYIGGASMGGLIGAMYAMGKTPDEIERLVNSLDWEKLLQTSPPLENLSFRRKEDRRNIPSPLILRGKANNLQLPNALSSGQEIGLLFDRETLAYASVGNFDALPIPFRTVATDMVRGESIELKSGSLSQALRATMSFPAVFAPIEIDGRLLADGGLVNNIPTDVVKAMGADILIVVNIEATLDSRESLDSLPNLLTQAINIGLLENSRRGLRQADFIIAPDLENYTLADFTESESIIELGYQGAKQKIKLLQSLSLNDIDWQAHLDARRRRKPPETATVPTFLTVEGKEKNAVKAVEKKLGGKYVNQPLDQARQNQLARDLTDLTGTNRFDTLNYGLTKRQNETGLLIRTNEAVEKSAQSTRLELGLDLNSVELDNVNFNVSARLTFFDVGRYGAEWRNDLRLGSDARAATEYFLPLGGTKFFVAPRASYERRKIIVFSDGARLAEYSGETAEAGFDLGYSFNSRSELRGGLAVGYEKAVRRIGDSLLPNLRGKFSRATIGWTYDGLDKIQVPTGGNLSRNSIEYYFDSPGADGKFVQAQTLNSSFRSIGKRNILFGLADGAATFGGTASPLRQFTLGGPLRLGGYGYEEFRAGNYLHGAVGILHNPKILPAFLGGKIYLGAWYEAGSAFEKIRRANYRQSVSGGLLVETPLGPVFVGGGLNENGGGKFYFSLGKFFY